MSEDIDPRPWSIETQQPVGAESGYKTPFERAQDAFERAEAAEGELDWSELSGRDAALLGYSVAQCELAAAQLEVLERIERAVSRSGPSGSAKSDRDRTSELLEQLADQHYRRAQQTQGGTS